MYHVNAQGVDERMVNIYIIIMMSLKTLPLVMWKRR